MLRYIKTGKAAPPPKGVHYAHAVEALGFLHVTGQLPIDPAEPDAALPPDIDAQAELVFRNLGAIVEAAGYRLSDTVFVRIYLSAFERDYDGLNRIYQRYFADEARMPARTTIGVVRLGRNALVEIDLVVAKP
ncbi:RidA family protein [Rhizobium sp. YIM 134829]|uniref:RidA family protein n=1 Tax=Rhizobium sp. YIM 134829 TaxID=3390453 RepID=UPI0039795D4F